MNTPTSSWKRDLSLLTMGLLFFYLLFLGHYAVFSPDESRYSEIAREMLVSGDYITPRVNGIVFLDKPILHYWLQTIAIRLLGVNEWAFRIVPALLAILCILVTYISGRLMFDRQTGLLASLILATSPLFFIGSHYANLDLEVASFISISLLCFITSMSEVRTSRTIWLFCAYFSCGLAILTKGLIGLVFPTMIIGSWILITSQWNLLLNMHLVKGLGLIFMMNAPWYYLAEQANPGFFQYFFINQQFTRFTSSTAHFNNPTPFWFYLPIIIAGMIPWSFFLIQAIYSSIMKDLKSLTDVESKLKLFLLLWIILITLFFSIPRSKPITYILPIFPACALFLAYYFISLRKVNPKYLLKWCTVVIIFNLLALLLATYHADKLNNKSLKPLILTLKHQLHENDIVINYYKHFPDVPLYLEQPVIVVNNWEDKKIPKTDNWAREFWVGQQFQKTDHLLIDETTFQKIWHGNQRVYTFVGDNFLTAFKAQVRPYYLIAHHHSHYYLFSNKPA